MSKKVLPMSVHEFLKIATPEEVTMLMEANNLYAMADGFPKYSKQFRKKAGRIKNRLIKSIQDKASVCS